MTGSDRKTPSGWLLEPGRASAGPVSQHGIAVLLICFNWAKPTKHQLVLVGSDKSCLTTFLYVEMDSSSIFAKCDRWQPNGGRCQWTSSIRMQALCPVDNPDRHNFDKIMTIDWYVITMFFFLTLFCLIQFVLHCNVLHIEITKPTQKLGMLV